MNSKLKRSVFTLATIALLLPLIGIAKKQAEAPATEEPTTNKTEDKSTKDTDERQFKPSYMTIDGNKHVKVDDWTDPRVCGQCHTEQYKGWNGSMHSNAFKDPVFQALWAIGEKKAREKGKDGFGFNMTNHCGSCHSPIGVATGTIKFNPDDGLHGSFSAPGVAAMGVSCDVCHTIAGTNITSTATLEHGNASIILDPGNVKRANLKDAKSPMHETEYSEHHDSSKFCGNCHNIFHPVNNFPVERTYDEWKYSIYAQNGIQCQDCHMVPVEVAEKVADTLKRPTELLEAETEGFAGLGGKMRKVIHKHGFVGGNAIVTDALNKAKKDDKAEDVGSKSNYDAAVKRLRGVATMEVNLKQKADTLHQLDVKVTNKRAGHNLPTSLTEVREIWLEVIVTDDKGKELFRSGTLDKGNNLPAETVVFNAHAVDKDGKHTHYPWEITRFTHVNTIPPRGYKTSSYSFNVPKGTKKVNTKVILHYRSFSQILADELMGKGTLVVPNIEMITDEHAFDPEKLNVDRYNTPEAH
jgi:Zn-finger protein